MKRILRLLLPPNSRRAKKIRSILTRFRSRQLYQRARGRYNQHRREYYAHAITITPKKQENKVSIVVPCFNTPPRYFEPLLASILAQGYENWEFVLVDASTDQKHTNYLKSKVLADERIQYYKVPNKGIAINTNVGIAKATGDYIAFLDHDDVLDPDALAETMALFSSDPTLGLVYSDEDKISEDGDWYFEPHFKPDFSLDMLRNVNYITHFVVAKTSLVRKLEGIREDFDGAQDYDFLLRVADEGVGIGHVSKILYHWRQAQGSTAADFASKPNITKAGSRALDDHYQRRGIQNAKNSPIPHRPGFYKPTYDLSGLKKMSVYINLEDYELLPREREYILDSYTKNHDVEQYQIEIIEGRPTKPKIGSNTLVVNGPFVPADETADIASLFGVAHEKGVSGVSPKILHKHAIFDMGKVLVEGRLEPLFRGVRPGMPEWFGSLEWVRNVNEVSDYVSIKTGEALGRNIVWSHSEFIAYVPLDKKKNGGATFYNPNLSQYTEITDKSVDYVMDHVEVKK